MASGASKAARPVFPQPTQVYSPTDEAAFRREVERFMEAIAESVVDVSSLPAHASNHEAGGSDPLSHSNLPDLGVDDHTQYHTDARAATWHDARAVSTHSDITITGIGAGELLEWNGSAWINQTLAELDLPTLSGANTFAGACDFTNNDVEISGASPRLSLTESDGDDYELIVSSSEFFIKNVSDTANVDCYWRTSNDTDMMRLAGNASGYLSVNVPQLRLVDAANYLAITTGSDDMAGLHVRGGAGSEQFRIARLSSAFAWEATVFHIDLQDGDTEIYGDLYPDADGSQDLGLSSNAWHNLWCRDISADSGQDLLFWSGGQSAEIFRLQTNNNFYQKLGYRAENQDIGAKSANFTIDPRDGVKQYITLSNSGTINMTWEASSVQAGALLILTIRRSSNSGAMNFPGDVDWGTAGAPTIPTTAGQAICVILYAHSASEWQGAEFGQGGFTLADI